MEIVEALPQSHLMENSRLYRWFSLVYAHTLRVDLYLVWLGEGSRYYYRFTDGSKGVKFSSSREHLFSRPLEIYDTLVARYGSSINWVGFDGKRGPQIVQEPEANYLHSPSKKKYYRCNDSAYSRL